MRAATMLAAPPEWSVADGLTPYPEALAAMEARVAAIRAGEAAELVWLVEHPPSYTAGTSATAGRAAWTRASRCSGPGAAGSGPITGPASAPPM